MYHDCYKHNILGSNWCGIDNIGTNSRCEQNIQHINRDKVGRDTSDEQFGGAGVTSI